MATNTSTTYTSQQSAIMSGMVSYLQNPANWAGGVPLITDFTPGSVVFTLLSSVSVAIDALGLAIFMARLSAYISTAVGYDLDNKVNDFGLTRKPATPATGTVTFTRNTPATSNITVPGGSIVSTVPSSLAPSVSFATDADAILEIGQTNVNASVTAQAPGTSSNIAAAIQLLVSSMIPGIDNVIVSNSITDGSDEESDEDLRARGLAAFVALAHGTTTSYQQIVLAVAGVAGAFVVPQGRGPGTVDIFIMGPDSSIPSDDVVAQAQIEINAQKVATDDVLVRVPSMLTVDAEVSVHVAPGYDGTRTSEAISLALAEHINGLGIGAGMYGYVYASHLVSAALSVTGVLNATTTYPDTAILPREIPVAGVFTVNVI